MYIHTCTRICMFYIYNMTSTISSDNYIKSINIIPQYEK